MTKCIEAYNRKLTGRTKCGSKSGTSNRDGLSLGRIVEERRFKNLETQLKSRTEAGVSVSEPPWKETTAVSFMASNQS